MVTLVFLCRRRSDLTHARYVELLLDGHVPLALRHHPTLRRYVVNIVEDGVPELDSIGELSFDSLADFEERLYDTPDGRRMIERDVAGFMGGADAYVLDGVAAAAGPVGGRPPGAKIVAGAVAAPGTDAATLVTRLAGTGDRVSAVVRRLAGGAPYDVLVTRRDADLATSRRALEAAAGPLLGTLHVWRVAEWVQR